MPPHDASLSESNPVVVDSASNLFLDMHVMRESVKPYIDLIDKLRELGIEHDLQGGIPQIAVMGDQSSGKSSVLEALSGVQFPRGTGLVTKCATEVRMRSCKNSELSSYRVSLSWSKPQPEEAGTVVTREDIEGKIALLTELLLADRGGGGKKASFEKEHAIVVEMVAPDIPDLTIIDLPGMVRTAVDGQDESVIQDVKSLLDRYLKQERTVILAVVPCNVDIATVGIINDARKADPQGQRTIGVLTKPDLIARGEEESVVETLRNVKAPLELGYIMVKNRGQDEINGKVALSEAKRKECEFFETHPHFRKEDTALFGVERLEKRLSEILVERIKCSLPEMKTQVDAALRETQESLNGLGDAPPETTPKRRKLLRESAGAITRDVRDASYFTMYQGVLAENKELRMVARYRKGASRFSDSVLKLKPERTVEGIKALVAELRGRELPGMANPAVMRVLVTDFVKRWQAPVAVLLRETEALVVEGCHGIIANHVKGEGRLQARFKAEVKEMARKAISDVRDVDVAKLFENELEPQTENHYFLDTCNKIKHDALLTALDKCLDSHQASEVALDKTALRGSLVQALTQLVSIGSSNAEQEANELHAILAAYFKTAAKRFIDACTMHIDRCMLQGLGEAVEKTLAGLADGEDKDVEALFDEDQTMRVRRAYLENKVARLSVARQLLVSHGPTEAQATRAVVKGIAGSDDAGAIVRIMQHSSSLEVQAQGCKRLGKLWANLEDVVAEGVVEAVVKGMVAHLQSVGVQEGGCEVLAGLSIKKDDKRVAVAAKGGIEAVINAMKEHVSSVAVQAQGCSAIVNLSISDHNKVVMAANGGTEAVVRAMEVHVSSADVQLQGCKALFNLAANAGKVAVAEKGGIEAAINAMKAHVSIALVQEQGCMALIIFGSHNAENQLAIAAKGGMEVVIDAMEAHASSAAVQERACSALIMIALNHAENKTAMAARGGIEAVLRGMETHAASARVQEAGCLVLHNVGWSEKGIQARVRKAGAVPLVEKALAAFPDREKLQEYGKAVLEMNID